MDPLTTYLEALRELKHPVQKPGYPPVGGPTLLVDIHTLPHILHCLDIRDRVSGTWIQVTGELRPEVPPEAHTEASGVSEVNYVHMSKHGACPICGKSYKQLKTHMKRMHGTS